MIRQFFVTFEFSGRSVRQSHFKAGTWRHRSVVLYFPGDDTGSNGTGKIPSSSGAKRVATAWEGKAASLMPRMGVWMKVGILDNEDRLSNSGQSVWDLLRTKRHRDISLCELDFHFVNMIPKRLHIFSDDSLSINFAISSDSTWHIFR